MTLAAGLAVLPSAVAAPPKADGAATGPFYDIGGPMEEAGKVPGWTPTQFGQEWDISAPAGAGTPGPRVWMNWNVCGAGMVVSELRWQGARAATATSPLYAFRVTDTGATTYATSANLRDDLAGAIYPTRKAYSALTGACQAQLRIDQVLTSASPGSDPAKRYWITLPRAIARDIEAPKVQIDAVQGGWISAQTASVAWTTTDNFEGSGFGNQHVMVDGVGTLATGWHRQMGSIAAEVNVSAVPDGVHTLRVRADGDGTASTDATGTLRVDRTPPAHGIALSRVGRGRVSVAVNVADAASGTTSWSVLLPDGSVAASQATGTGPLGNLDLSRFDGQDVVLQLVVRDAAGNDAQASSAPIAIDVTAPSVSVTTPTGWVAALSEAEPLLLGLSDNRADGVGSVELSVNAAPNGSASGPWVRLAGLGATALGTKSLHPALPVGIGDGVHRVRVTAADPRDPSLATTVDAQLAIDTTSPTLGDPGAWSLTRSAPTQASLVLPDVDDSASGVATVRVYGANDPTGADTGGYRLLGSAPGTTATTSVPLSLAALTEGRHATLVEAEDAAGNLTSLPGPVMVVDRTAPIVAGVDVSTDGRILTWRQSDGGGFGACLTLVEIAGVGTSGAWQRVHEVAGAAVPASGGLVELPVRGMAPGDYQVRVTACDEAGNTGSALTRMLRAADGTTSVIAPPAASGGTTPGPAGVSTSSPGSTGLGSSTKSGTTPRGPRNANIVERIVDLRIDGQPVSAGVAHVIEVGRQITLTGILVRQGGDLGSSSSVRVMSPRRGTLATATAHSPSGKFTARLRPKGAGQYEVTSQLGGRAVIRIAVRPRLTVKVNRAAFTLGQEMVVTGRIHAGMSVRGKLLQLQWKDGTRWRPVANLSARADGRFTARYRFRRARGYSVAMRIVVPAERGWPLVAAAGKAFTIRVK